MNDHKMTGREAMKFIHGDVRPDAQAVRRAAMNQSTSSRTLAGQMRYIAAAVLVGLVLMSGGIYAAQEWLGNRLDTGGRYIGVITSPDDPDFMAKFPDDWQLTRWRVYRNPMIISPHRHSIVWSNHDDIETTAIWNAVENEIFMYNGLPLGMLQATHPDYWPEVVYDRYSIEIGEITAWFDAYDVFDRLEITSREAIEDRWHYITFEETMYAFGRDFPMPTMHADLLGTPWFQSFEEGEGILIEFVPCEETERLIWQRFHEDPTATRVFTWTAISIETLRAEDEEPNVWLLAAGEFYDIEVAGITVTVFTGGEFALSDGRIAFYQRSYYWNHDDMLFRITPATHVMPYVEEIIAGMIR
ncbi:MAG: hypothetical protein FWC71_06825 [Defluviitaleaceae bacterium]|nr:hypothetical protein [Defluviitaleaceae bacterium]